MEDHVEDKKKAHRERRAGKQLFGIQYLKIKTFNDGVIEKFVGRKADKKKVKDPHVQEMDARQRNPKAFAIQSVAKAQKRFHR